jgi:putative endonuclease
LYPGYGADVNRRYFVYILTNRPRGVLYIGVTNDLIRRLSEHKGKLEQIPVEFTYNLHA